MTELGTRCRLLVALSALAVWTAAPAHAQTLRGQVLDATNQNPVPAATLRLLDADSVEVASTIATDVGRFSVVAPAPGEFWVLIEGLGYDPTYIGPVRLRAQGFAEVTMVMNPRPIPIDSVDVQVDQRDIWLERSGFYDRMGHGGGVFMEGPALLRRAPSLGEAVGGLAGIRLITTSGMTDIQMRGRMTDLFRGTPRICLPQIYLDGLIVAEGDTPGVGRFNLASVRTDEVAAIEVYGGEASVPLQYARGGGACGTMLIWTKSP